jgi:hypothetical protein
VLLVPRRERGHDDARVHGSHRRVFSRASRT